MTDAFQNLVSLVRDTSISSAAGKLLYSSRETLKRGEFYVIGFNPGGDREVENETVFQHLLASPEKDWSEYTCSRWRLNGRLYEQGAQPRQRRIKSLGERLGLDFKKTFCTNAIFARDATVKKSKLDPLYQNFTEECAAIHGFLIETVKPRFVICFGHHAFDLFRKFEASESFRNATDLSSIQGSYKLIRLPHFSLRSSDADFLEKAAQAFNLQSGEGSVVTTQSRGLEDFPVVVLEDRYGGVYSKGRWLAIAEATKLENGSYRVIRCLEDGGPHGDDTDAMLFWADPPNWIAVGDTPNEAVDALTRNMGSRGPDGTHEL